jgi:hypothetical protein
MAPYVARPAAASVAGVASDPRGPLPYRLFAVVVHQGGKSGGHYIAYVRGTPSELDHLAPGTAPRRAAAGTGSAQLSQPLRLPPPPRLCEPLLGNPGRSAFTPELSDAAAGLPWDGRVWYYCSDSSVHPVAETEVLGAQAYLLLYERI